MEPDSKGFYLFRISPPKRPKVVEFQELEETPPILTLVSFSIPPTVEFGSVILGQSCTKCLLVRNPNNAQIHVMGDKFPTANGFQSLQEFKVDSRSDFNLEIVWTPQILGPCRQTAHYKGVAGLRARIIFSGICIKDTGVKAKKYERPKNALPSAFAEKLKRNIKNKENVTPRKEPLPYDAFRIQDETYPLPSSPMRRQTFVIDSPDTGHNNLHSVQSVPNAKVFQQIPSDFVAPLAKGNVWGTHSATAQFRPEQRRETYLCRPTLSESFDDSLEIINDSLQGTNTENPGTNIQSPFHLLKPGILNPKFNLPEMVEDCHSKGAIPKIRPNIHRKHSQYARKFVLDQKCDYLSPTPAVSTDRTFTKLQEQDVLSMIAEESMHNSKSVGAQKTYVIYKPLDSMESVVSKSIFERDLQGPLLDMNVTSSLCDFPNDMPLMHRCSTGVKDQRSMSPEGKMGKKSLNFSDPMPSTDLAKNEAFFIGLEPSGPNVEEELKATRRDWKRNSQRVPSVRRSTHKILKKSTLKKSPIKKASRKRCQEKLIFVKPTTKVIPFHPNPFASNNKYYDELWMKKEEFAFTQWLNFTLRPPLGLDTNEEKIEVDARKLWSQSLLKCTPHKAPTKEELSFQQYKLLTELNKLRRNACLLFQSEPMVKIITKLESEISRDLIAIREDVQPQADYGIQNQIINSLLSYNPLWLRIGLETIYGKCLSLKSEANVTGLSQFIAQQMLFSPDIARNFTNPNVKNLYKPGYEKEIKKFILKKFLLLVLFLDKAKVEHLIDHDPCLFRKEAKIKKSKDLLLNFSRDYLKGEGDLLRRLRRYECTVQWEQKPLEEYDYTVRNLTVDLRCGTRLVRVVELLLREWTLLKKLLYPAPSQTQKKHNVQLALEALKANGIKLPSDLKPMDIVESHREKTLSLLWILVFNTSVQSLLKDSLLQLEIGRIRRLLYVKDCTRKLQRDETFTVSEGILEGLALLEDVSELAYKPQIEDSGLLLEWTQAVCAFFNVRVENLTVSFSDGRAFCYLLHFYCPNLLRIEDIRNETSHLFTTEQGATFSEASSVNMKRCTANEKFNLNLAFEKMKLLGNVPILTCAEDMSNTIPDEKVVVTQLAYLSSCLMDLSRNEWAVRIIQVRFRYKLFKRKMEKIKAQTALAVKLQQAIRGFLCRCKIKKWKKASVVIQSAWRCYAAKNQLDKLKNEKINRNATIIQAHYLAFRQRKVFKKQREMAIRIQSWVRCWQAQKRLKKLKTATQILQSKIIAWRKGRIVRQEFLSFRNSVSLIQRNIRMWLARRRYQAYLIAVTRCQAVVRGFVARRNLQKKIIAAKTIQLFFKNYKDMKNRREEFFKIKSAVLSIQCFWRKVLSQKEASKQNQAAVLIQSAFRRYICRKRFSLMKSSAVLIQQHWKANALAKKDRANYLNLKKIVILIQRQLRRILARRLKQNLSALIIQKNWRCFSACKKFALLKSSVATVEDRWIAKVKGRVEHVKFIALKTSVTILQAYFRGKIVRNEIRKQKAAVVIQKTWRKYSIRKAFIQKKKSATVIQRKWHATLKSKSERSYFLNLRSSVIKMQSFVRGNLVRKEFRKLNTSAVLIQTYWKGYLARKTYSTVKTAVSTIQMHWRTNRAAKVEHLLYNKLRMSSVVIQKHVRGMLVRKENRKKNMAAVMIQKYVRGMLVRKEKKRMNMAAIQIQKMVRGRMVRNSYLKLRQSSITIQLHWRSIINTKLVREEYLSKKKACLLIQRRFREKVHREDMRRHSAAVIIQKTWRGSRALNSYMKYRKAVCTIQGLFRTKCQRKEYLKLKTSAIRIQSAVRGMVIRNQIRKRHSAAIKIQKMVRGRIARRKYLKQRSSIVTLQRFWLSKRELKKYLNLRKSCLTIQRQFRKKLALDNLRKHTAALVIQKTWKGSRDCRSYAKYRSSACTIQRYVRARKERLNYLKLKSTAIKVQSVVRGMIVRREIRNQNTAAIFIQKVVKSRIVRQKYLKQKASVITIQKFWRSSREREKYLKMKRSCILIQRHFRVKLARDILRKNAAALLIQKSWKGSRAYKSYTNYRSAVCIIQRYFRSRCQRAYYLKLKSSAIRIQSVVRGVIVRMEIKKRHAAAIVIQNAVRGRLARRNYLNQLESAITLQQFWRSYVKTKRTREEYLIKKKLCTIIQRRFREKVYRENLRKHAAAVIIQKTWRGSRALKSYTKYRTAVRTVQGLIRTKHQRKEFLKLKASAICIQSVVRGMIIRKQIQKKHNAAIMIQKMVKGRLARQTYLKQRASVFAIQQFWRSKREQDKYLLIRKSCIIIQRCFRERLVKDNLRKCAAALVIQKMWKGTRTRKNYLKLKSSVILIQSLVRGRIVRKETQKKMAAAILIHKIIRGREERSRYLKKRAAVITLQKYWISYVDTQQKREKFLKIKRSCILIQRCYRIKVLQETQKHVAAQIIQKVWKGSSARKSYTKLRNAACILQRHFRAKHLRNEYLKLRASAIRIQSMVRSVVARNKFKILVSSSIIIQKVWRGYKTRELCRKIKASLVIQKHWRLHVKGKTDRSNFLYTRMSVIQLQRYARGMLIRQKIKKCHASATIIQSTWKSYCMRRRFLELKTSTICIQSRWRATVLARQEQQNFLRNIACIVKVQRHVREFISRREQKKLISAVITVQKLYRGKQCELKFRKLKSSTIVIQRCWREIQVMKQDRQSFCKLKVSVVTLQAHVRSWKCRREFLAKKDSAVLIQSVFRMFRAKKMFQKLKNSVQCMRHKQELQNSSACVIQKCFRRYIQRKLQAHNLAATKIQAAFRCWLARKTFKVYLKSISQIQCAWKGKCQRKRFCDLKLKVIAIQRYWRAINVKRDQRKKFHLLQRSAVVIQNYWRTYRKERLLTENHAAIVIQAAYRRMAAKKALDKQKRLDVIRICAATKIKLWFQRNMQARAEIKRKNAATAIQAMWKGYSVRKNMTAELGIILENVNAAKAGINGQEKVASVLANGVRLLLLDGTTVARIIRILKKIKELTRLHQDFCEALINGDAIPAFRAHIKNSNRSPPYIEIQGLVYDCLLNLTRWEIGRGAMWEDKELIKCTRLQLMRYPNHNTQLFTKAATLIWILCQDPAKLEVFKSNTQLREELEKIKIDLARKEKFKEKQQKARNLEPKPCLCRSRVERRTHNCIYKFSTPIAATRALLKLFAN